MQSILITGCSSGIGYAAALALKQRGYRVFAGARKQTDVERLTAEGLEGIQIDVNDTLSMRRGLDTILMRTGGTLDALFNNAGYLQAGAVEDLTPEMMRGQFETNVFGSISMTQLVLPVMRKQGHGRIIQNSSILGIVTVAYCGAYNASKFAIEGFINTLRLELRHSPIHVSLINPGPITSKLREHAHQHYQQTIKQSQSGHYQQHYEKLEQSYFKPSKQDRALAQSPQAVINKLIHALESPRPKAHYYVGFAAHALAWLRRLLPDTMLDWILAKSR
jgi:NAD(P)-dependent dehydrogenase (short-subunit alcohol dehydrogenase family)